MGVLHQQLYHGEVDGTISLPDYLRELGDSLLDTFALDDRVDIYYDVEDIRLDLDTAIPLGLIVNELLTNALKYAFPGDRQGLIEVTLLRQSGEYTLRVADDGVGDLSQEEPNRLTFGTRLLDLLADKLGGRLRRIEQKGYGVEVRWSERAARSVRTEGFL